MFYIIILYFLCDIIQNYTADMAPTELKGTSSWEDLGSLTSRVKSSESYDDVSHEEVINLEAQQRQKQEKLIAFHRNNLINAHNLMVEIRNLSTNYEENYSTNCLPKKLSLQEQLKNDRIIKQALSALTMLLKIGKKQMPPYFESMENNIPKEILFSRILIHAESTNAEIIRIAQEAGVIVTFRA